MMKALPPILFILGLVLMGVGERILGAGHALRLLFTALGVFCVAATVVLRLIFALKASPEHRPSAFKLLAYYGVAALGLCLYGWGLNSADLGGGLPYGAVIWPILLLTGSLAALLTELSLLPMHRAQTWEVRRLDQAGRVGLTLALALSWLVALNFLANAHNQRLDYRSVGNLKPSGATAELVRNLAEPLEITLFFPPSNEVLRTIEGYFEGLAAENPSLVLTRIDRDMYPAKAKAKNVRRSGTVVISRGEIHEKIHLGVEESGAERKLKTLDSDTRKAIYRAARDRRVAYFIIGHGERLYTHDDRGAPTLRNMRKALESMNYQVQKLGLNQGLAEGVPADATLVILAGPKQAMLKAEEEAITRFVERGGALLWLADPDIEADPQLTALAQLLGVEPHYEMLAHDAKFVRYTRSQADRQYLFTNRFVAHPAIKGLGKMGGQGALVLPHVGHLSLVEGAGTQARITVRSLPGTFNDANGNLQFDGASEARQSYDLFAAIDDIGAQKGKAVVGADVDFISDDILQLSAANQQWLLDSIRFLEGDVDGGGAVAPLADVPVIHTRDGDRLLFFGSILGIPLFILGLGLLSHRRRMGRGGEG